MPYEHVLIQVADRVATVTVNRPDKLNALDDVVIAELGRAADELRERNDVAGILVTGAGAKAFVAGADIGELSRQGPFDAKARALRGQATFRKFETSPKPVVAAVNGFALGGGCELAMACHLRVASAKAKFGQPEVNLGITPGYGGTQRLPRLVGKGRALDIILTGRMVDAEEALRIGLVNRVVPPETVLTEAEALLRVILAKGPLAVALVLEAVDRGSEMSLDDGLQLEANHFGLAAASADMREGMAAFLEKRDAHFRGA
jgi:enoyl-CoA hydratase